MKSPMITNASYIAEDEKGCYSALKVMRSGAGWYVGTEFRDPSGFTEPGSRDSGYFPTEQDAADYLKMVEAGLMTTRMNP